MCNWGYAYADSYPIAMSGPTNTIQDSIGMTMFPFSQCTVLGVSFLDEAVAVAVAVVAVGVGVVGIHTEEPLDTFCNKWGGNLNFKSRLAIVLLCFKCMMPLFY